MWKLETKKKGIAKILRPYQIHVITILSQEPRKPWSNAQLWESCLENHVQISRASVIQFTKAMSKDQLIEAIPISGKGGKTFAYKIEGHVKEIENHIIKRLVQNINEVFPREELQKVIVQLKTIRR